tara:strand:- start:230 stop:625 length:396 start_codon:yes stop_codon:yes gene_type:complete
LDYGDSLLNALIKDGTGLFWALGLVVMPRMASRLRPFGGEQLRKELRCPCTNCPTDKGRQRCWRFLFAGSLGESPASLRPLRGWQGPADGVVSVSGEPVEPRFSTIGALRQAQCERQLGGGCLDFARHERF